MSNNIQLEAGTYEIIRNRLLKQGENLRQRLDQLNESRKTVFGAIETQLIANARVTTNNFCIARDVFAIGNRCIFGYNVHIGLRSGIKLSDVFSIYEFRDNDFHEGSLKFLKNEQFDTDFNNLYRYYRETTFSKFAVIGGYLYMVFQVSQKVDDIKVFKWLINGDQLEYVDGRSEHEFRFPKQHDFQWKRAGRDEQRDGQHPHISILDRVFVETVGGDLTIKVEDNTEDGKGIYNETVDHSDQTLDDAEYYYADLGNLIALKIRPYQEDYRHFIFNEKMQQVRRIDSLSEAAVMLPDNQGVMFANGYYLQTGEYKIFDEQRRGKLFERRIPSPNGEDHLYVFYSKTTGRYVLMSYNMIEQKVETPIVCHGYTLFPNGELCYFRAEEEPTKHHVVQIWQTPYVTGDEVPSEHTDSYLYKVGNRDIVKAMAESNEVLNLLRKEDSYAGLYIDLTRKAGDILDAYYWIDKAEAAQINIPLGEIKASANSAIEEFEKVQRIKKNTAAEIERVSKESEELFHNIRRANLESVEQFVELLAALRKSRGEIISLRELRYTDEALIEELEAQAVEYNDQLSQQCVEFLLDEKALIPYEKRVKSSNEAVVGLQTATQTNELGEQINQIGEDLKLLIDIVSNLKIEDATQTTRIIDNISAIYASLNQVKAAQSKKRKELLSTEAVAEFAAQFRLLDQSIVNYLDVADSPEKCDDFLTKLMVQLEELEGKFAEFDEFIAQITEKREEVYNAFESRKVSLAEARNRRATALQSAAERILNGIKNRVKSFQEVAEINGFFAADLMVDKVRDIVKQLTELEDNVKADDLQGQLKSAKEDAIRQLRDKQDLFVAGENVIKLGKHHFSVNTQPLDLTIINKNDRLHFHLSGTNFFEEIKDKQFNQLQPVWNQALISENEKVYRGEYLAYQLFKKYSNGTPTPDEDQIPEAIHKFARSRYQEGYTKGIHDEDAALILKELLQLHEHIDLLHFAPKVRAAAQLFWERFLNEEQKALFDQQLQSAGVILEVFPETQELEYLIQQLESTIASWLTKTKLFHDSFSPLGGQGEKKTHFATKIAQYLFAERSANTQFVLSKEAAELHDEFLKHLKKKRAKTKYEQSVKNLQQRPSDQFRMIEKWVQAFVEQCKVDHYLEFTEETSVTLLLGNLKDKRIIQSETRQKLAELHGEHSSFNGHYTLDYNAFMQRLEAYESEVVPQFQQYHDLKHQKTEAFRQQLRLEEFKPRVLSSFVRNQLIDQVYLPIFGDNLAKQIGAVGENTRTDRMGMLLLISPPGYGKTTLMEYIASQLGLIFMKINGPAIGHQVTSLDPADAKNAATKKELEKLNLALEMGDNIMLYLDDIQHCNPEFLQKFISLTDGQRKIEGVYKGVTKTYDLRGKKVCVVMAGNPYTESGEKFRIPDMLANRSDIYNLGDIIGDTRAVFEMSYIENSLTSNPVLQKLANKSLKDVHQLVQLVYTGSREGMNLEGNHTPEEINEYVQILQKMLTVRDVVLKVNLEYIRSAAQADQYRTEPPFLLQGSYRNMNKLAEKIVPIMNEQELQTLLLSHYEGEAQTLTTGTEANLLKFKELIGKLSEEEAARWKAIKATYVQSKKRSGSQSMAQILRELRAFTEGLEGIRKVLEGK